MRKQLFIFALLILPLIVGAQEIPFRVKSSNKFSSSFLAGKVDVDSVSYYQLRYIQELDFNKFGIGLDFDFLFDKHYHIRKSDWDNILDYLGIIYYMRYGELDDPYYGHLGGFARRSVLNGLVMHNYSNMAFYPDQRQIGILLGANPEIKFSPQFEAFSSNIRRAPVIALSGRFSPLEELSSPYINKLQLGMSFFSDTNQKTNLKKVLPDSLYQVYKDSPASALSIVSVDYQLPILKTDKFIFGNYAEMAHILGHGTGMILPGLYIDVKHAKLNLEYRIHGDSFMADYFDNFYEEERAVCVDGTLLTKEKTLKDSPASYGFYGKLEGNIKGRVKSMIAWQNMYGDGVQDSKSLWFRLWVDTRYKRLENVAFNYSKTRVDELRLGKVAVPRARMSGSFTLSLDAKRRWFLIGSYSEKYKDKEGGIKWWKDTKRSVSAGLKVSF